MSVVTIALAIMFVVVLVAFILSEAKCRKLQAALNASRAKKSQSDELFKKAWFRSIENETRKSLDDIINTNAELIPKGRHIDFFYSDSTAAVNEEKQMRAKLRAESDPDKWIEILAEEVPKVIASMTEADHMNCLEPESISEFFRMRERYSSKP